MLQGVHIIGYGPSDGKCLPCSGISGRVAPLYSCSGFNHKLKSQVRIGPLKSSHKGVSFTCRASSSSRNRNPEYGRQNRHGSYFRGRNRRNEERDGFDNLEESDLLSSKNGISPSSSTKFGAIAAPGPREKDIVELFRKVQAQLRERTAVVKEEKKVEALQGQGKENETVDSLLKLLKKHSVEQAKRTSNSGENKDLTLDQPEKNARHSERNTASLVSNNSLKDEGEEIPASFRRPTSNFQRKSPIPRMTYQPMYSEDDHLGNSVPHINGKRKKNQEERVTDLDPEPVLELEAELEPEAEHDTGFEFEREPEPEQELVQLLEDDTLDTAGILNDDDENDDKQQSIEQEDLTALKLPELRALAKSRGVKGFSKMKKSELVALLSGSSD